jgi:hypothetical protein
MHAQHAASPDDRAFLAAFEAHAVPPAAFNHREHLRLAYVCLCESRADEAQGRVRAALQAFIAHHGVDPAKYHETITRAWVLAVDYFMRKSEGPFESFDAFIAADPRLLDSSIMLTHYSKERLFSEQARTSFIEPDLQEIPD